MSIVCRDLQPCCDAGVQRFPEVTVLRLLPVDVELVVDSFRQLLRQIRFRGCKTSFVHLQSVNCGPIQHVHLGVKKRIKFSNSCTPCLKNDPRHY